MHVALAVAVISVAAAEAEAAVVVATREAAAGITPNNPMRTSMFKHPLSPALTYLAFIQIENSLKVWFLNYDRGDGKDAGLRL